ncbi:putative tyrosine--tRNA ligase [Helianthus annuus]|nr:putative tyrosine--tRNA ligase [Helianthus annuus]
MVSLNTFSIQISPVFKCPIPGLDYVVFVKGSGPHDIQYHYQQDRPPNEVIVSRKCAEAVLRGAQRAVLMLKKRIKLQFRLVLNSPVVTVNGLRELHGQGFGKGVHNQNIRLNLCTGDGIRSLVRWSNGTPKLWNESLNYGFGFTKYYHSNRCLLQKVKRKNMIDKVKIWIADWFAQLNNKMGGDLGRIQTVGRYLNEIWKAAGMNLEHVEFCGLPRKLILGHMNTDHWCCQIMGRNEQDELTATQIFYPCMQCADIFFLKADICQLGMDQRKVNVLAREYCDDIKSKNKPVILSHRRVNTGPCCNTPKI